MIVQNIAALISDILNLKVGKLGWNNVLGYSVEQKL